MSEKMQTWPQFVEILSKIANDFGPSEALKRLHSFSVDGQYPEYVQGIETALNASSQNEKRRMLLLSRIMAFSGLYLPIESLFSLGLPKLEFILYADMSFGRLGDCLHQIALLLHAQNQLNLVLCIKSKLSKANRILITKTDSFNTDLPSIEINPPLKEYLWHTARTSQFSRSLLTDSSRSLFSSIPPLPNYKDLNLNESLVIHVRAGDALFDGALYLPPLSYYLNSIKRLTPSNVIVVSEPNDNLKYKLDDPVPSKIYQYCNDNNISCITIASKDVYYDAGILFWAKIVIASNSFFSKMLPLYNNYCSEVVFPTTIEGNQEWINDQSITFINCWERFDKLRWKDSLEYRLAWATSY